MSVVIEAGALSQDLGQPLRVVIQTGADPRPTQVRLVLARRGCDELPQIGCEPRRAEFSLQLGHRRSEPPTCPRSDDNGHVALTWRPVGERATVRPRAADPFVTQPARRRSFPLGWPATAHAHPASVAAAPATRAEMRSATECASLTARHPTRGDLTAVNSQPPESGRKRGVRSTGRAPGVAGGFARGTGKRHRSTRPKTGGASTRAAPRFFRGL